MLCDINPFVSCFAKIKILYVTSKKYDTLPPVLTFYRFSKCIYPSFLLFVAFCFAEFRRCHTVGIFKKALESTYGCKARLP